MHGMRSRLLPLPSVGMLSCHQTELGIVRVAKIRDDPRHRVQDEARQVLLDQIVLSLIAFLCDHWTMPRSTDPYFLQYESICL